MQPNNDSSTLKKKPTWYIFLLANVIVLVSCLVTWGMIFTGFSNSSLHLPTLICNLLAMGLIIIFLYIEYRNTIPKIVHFQKKWLYWYLLAIIIFILTIIFNFIFYYFGIQWFSNELAQLAKKRANWKFLFHVIIIGILTLLSITLQRYARFRIDLDIYRRVHGQNVKSNKKEKKPEKKSTSNKTDNTKNTSSGLLNEMDKN